MSKKIGISCNALSLGGGMERYTLDLIKEFNRRGIQPTIFTKKADFALLNALNIELHICNCGWCPSKIRDYYYSNWLSRKKVSTNVDVLIGCNRNLSSDIAICGGTHKGYVTAISRRRFSDKLIINLEQSYFNKARYVVAHSKMMELELVNYYSVPTKNIRVIYPPVDQRTFHEMQTEEKISLKRELGIPCEDTSFLFVSSSHQRKGLPLLLNYFENTKLPVKLIVVGKPLKSMRKNVISVGFTKEIQKYYWACDFSILASTYEPFGLVGVESILCGTPVVLANTVGCNEIINSNAKINFKSDDPKSLNHAINESLSFKKDIHTSCLTSDISLQFHVDQLLLLVKKFQKNDQTSLSQI